MGTVNFGGVSVGGKFTTIKIQKNEYAKEAEKPKKEPDNDPWSKYSNTQTQYTNDKGACDMTSPESIINDFKNELINRIKNMFPDWTQEEVDKIMSLIDEICSILSSKIINKYFNSNEQISKELTANKDLGKINEAATEIRKALSKEFDNILNMISAYETRSGGGSEQIIAGLEAYLNSLKENEQKDSPSVQTASVSLSPQESALYRGVKINYRK